MEQAEYEKRQQIKRCQQKLLQRKRNRRRRLIRRLFRLLCGCIGLAILVGFFSFICRRNVSKEEIPKSLLELLERNPETEAFVIAFPENKDRNYEIDLSGEVEKGKIPLFLQWDERWGYERYGNDFMAVTGCGPTCLSMVRCGLSGDADWSPLKVAEMAERQGYYVEGAGSSWNLMTTGAEQLGLTVEPVIYDEAHIIAELKDGSPIICIMGPGDFTTSGHFIVLTGVDDDGKLTVCDPNSKKNSEKSWDPYELIPQIRNLWSYTY